MKSLSSYIESNLKDGLLKSIYPNLIIENFDYDFDYISESIYNFLISTKKSNYEYIEEGSGVFKGNDKISEVVSNNIKDRFDDFKQGKLLELEYGEEDFECIDYEKFFFILFVDVKKLTVPFFRNKGEGYIEPKENDITFDKINKQFGIINIHLELPYDYFEHYDNCRDIVEHELNHCYRDYHRHLVGKSSTVDKDNQLKYIKKHNIIDFDKQVVLRYLSIDECNSYVASIEGELGNKKFKTYKDCIAWLDKNSDTWQVYKQLRNYCEEQKGRIYKLYAKTWKKFINHLSFVISNTVIEGPVGESYKKGIF